MVIRADREDGSMEVRSGVASCIPVAFVALALVIAPASLMTENDVAGPTYLLQGLLAAGVLLAGLAQARHVDP